MNKTKRTTIKGKGADIFLGQEYHKAGITEDNNTVKTVNKKSVIPAKQTKVTYFINEFVADQMEDIWLSLRKKFKRKKISKSRIAEIAIKNLIKDWEQKKDKSIIEGVLKGEK